jgi:hypothetical protein
MLLFDLNPASGRFPIAPKQLKVSHLEIGNLIALDIDTSASVPERPKRRAV